MVFIAVISATIALVALAAGYNLSDSDMDGY